MSVITKGPAVVCLAVLTVACGAGDEPASTPSAAPASTTPGATAPGSPGPRPRATPSALEEFSAEQAGPAACDGYTIDRSDSRLTVRKGGQVVLDEKTEERFERLIAHTCGNIGGDGRTALLYERFSGGAHCCSAVHLVPLADTGSPMLAYNFGNAAAPQPRQLDADRAWELAGYSDVFAYFELSYAASPSIPLVFDFDGTNYFVGTSRFGDHVRSYLDDTFRQINELSKEEGSEDGARGQALGVYGAYLILGRGPAGLAEIRERAPSVAGWVEDVAPEARRHLAANYGNAFLRD